MGRARACQTDFPLDLRINDSVRLRAMRARVFDVTPDPPRGGEKDDDADAEVAAVAPGLQRLVLVPLLAEKLSDIGKADAPRQRAEEGVDGKARHVHARNARRERDESADYG